MTLFELFSIVLMGIIVLIGIGVILGFILVGVIIINYFRWRHQEKKAASCFKYTTPTGTVMVP